MELVNRMNKRIIFLVMIGIVLISVVSAADVSYCCEKTTSGAWCQNSPQAACDENYLSAPTSCEATSYCRLGVCINSKEGDCMPNTPERTCTDSGGVWDARSKDEIPQCKLGCCLVGDQAAFVTLTRCRSLSSSYGVAVDYRTDITTETQCIASASPEQKGACVYEKDTERTCEMLTKKDCQGKSATIKTEFYEGYLCSAESLNTVCAPRGGTTCVDGKDGVYFMDTCGNVANIYDSNKLNDKNYWTYLAGTNGVKEDCGIGVSNSNSKSCGMCDYYLGSTCKKPERGGSPNYGNYICEDLGCTYKGQTYKHGETWCAVDKSAANTNNPGGSNSRLICYNGEVTVEPCAEFRQEVCIQSSIPTSQGNFRTADCRANKWQDCFAQTTQDDCENDVQRYCHWTDGKCVPLYTPGFNFWEEGDAQSICALASTQCNVVYSAGLDKMFGWTGQKGQAYDLNCVEKCKSENFLAGTVGITSLCLNGCKSTCVDDNGALIQSWKDNANSLCVQMGDCGLKKNYLGQNGYYTSLDKFITRGNGTA
jgi:hypothetical protein